MVHRWRVTRARLSDVPAIVAVQDAAWRADFAAWVPAKQLLRDPTESGQLWRERIAQAVPGCSVLVAADGDRVRGFAWSRPWTDTADLPDGTVKLNALYVDPGVQSRGAGSALMCEALSLAAGAGYGHAALWVIEANARARRFYEPRGWRVDASATKLWRGAAEVRYLRDVSAADLTSHAPSAAARR